MANIGISKRGLPTKWLTTFNPMVGNFLSIKVSLKFLWLFVWSLVEKTNISSHAWKLPTIWLVTGRSFRLVIAFKNNDTYGFDKNPQSMQKIKIREPGMSPLVWSCGSSYFHFPNCVHAIVQNYLCHYWHKYGTCCIHSNSTTQTSWDFWNGEKITTERHAS